MQPMLPYREPKILEGYDALVNVLTEKNITEVILVTGSKIKANGLTKELEDRIKLYGINITIFDKTTQNPTTQNVEDAVIEYNKNHCQAIIAFGGGSVMDCAKALGARIACPKRSLYAMRGLLRVKNKLPLLIAIPTTAGTGSETTLTAVLTDSKTNVKFTMNDFDLIPRYALLDPKLTLGLPKEVTVNSGLDALTHAIEAFVGRATTMTTRKYALDAISLIFDNLPIAYADGSNLKARENMLEASYLAGLAFTKSYVGYAHAIGHAIGGKYKVAHGKAVAISLPYCLNAYGKAVYTKLYKIGLHMDWVDEHTQKKEAAQIVINKLQAFNDELGIGNKLDQIILKDTEYLAHLADKEANPLYPVPKQLSARNLKSVIRCIRKGKIDLDKH